MIVRQQRLIGWLTGFVVAALAVSDALGGKPDTSRQPPVFQQQFSPAQFQQQTPRRPAQNAALDGRPLTAVPAIVPYYAEPTWMPVLPPPAAPVWPVDAAETPSQPLPVVAPVSLPERPEATGRSIITFTNRSGKTALVRLVGPIRAEVAVANGDEGPIHNVAPGRYAVCIRYGTPDGYRYSRGTVFDVEGTDTTYSHVTITLHTVVNGNYSVAGSTEAEFEAAAPHRAAARPSAWMNPIEAFGER